MWLIVWPLPRGDCVYHVDYVSVGRREMVDSVASLT